MEFRRQSPSIQGSDPMIQRESHLSRWTPTYIVFFVLAILVVALWAIDPGKAGELLGDSGVIQNLTAGFLFAGAMICLQRATRKISPVFKWAELSFLLVIYALREMDFHRRFTIEHLSNKKFYLGPDPMMAKIIAGAVVLLTVIALLHFTLSNMRYFFEQLKKLRPWAIQIIVWATLLFGAQILDKSPLRDYFIEHILEENMEFAASIMIVLILMEVSHRQDVSRQQSLPGDD